MRVSPDRRSATGALAPPVSLRCPGPGRVGLVLSHLRGDLLAGRGVPGWSALGVWLSVVVMVAVAGVLDVSFKRRNWLSRLLDVAEQEVDSAGCRGHRVVGQRLALGTAQRSDRSVVVGEVQVGGAPLGCGAAVLLGEHLGEFGALQVRQLRRQLLVLAVVLLEACGVGRVVGDHGKFDSHDTNLPNPACGWTWSVALNP